MRNAHRDVLHSKRIRNLPGLTHQRQARPPAPLPHHLHVHPSHPPAAPPPPCRPPSTSTHLTPRLQPVPNAFIAASFTANRPAYRSYLFLNCSQYATSSSVYTRRKNLSLCDSITS